MAAPKAQAAVPPPLAPPPAQPVSGISQQRRAIAPQLTETPKGQDPVKELQQRQRDAIAKATGNAQKAQDDAAGEDAAPAPKAESKPNAVPGDSSDGKKPAENSTDGKSASGKPDAKAAESKSDASEQPAETERRYDVQSLRKWAEKNPEEAALVRQKVFALPEDSNQEWIRLKNRERKLKEGLSTEREATVSAAKAERDAAEQAKAAIDAAAIKLSPIADLWEAVAEKIIADPQNPSIDFDAADAAFLENSKISIDDYMRLRARRAVGGGTEAAKLRAENARLKRELAGKPSDAIKSKAADSPAGKEDAGTAEPAAAVKEARDWSTEIDGKHKLRQLEGWNALLDAEMRRHHDPDMDEYSADPDQIADQILKREIERMSEEFAPEEKPKPKPNGAAKPNGQAKPKVRAEVPTPAQLTPKMTASDDEDDAKVGGMTWAQRQQRAIQRAMQRARGEIE